MQPLVKPMGMPMQQTPVQAAMAPQQPQMAFSDTDRTLLEWLRKQQEGQSPDRQLGQGILNGVLGGMFNNPNKIDQSEDAPWMSGMATGGLDDSLMKALQQYLGGKLF